MTTTLSRLKVGGLVRHSCSDDQPCAGNGRVGVLRSFVEGMWKVDFGDRREWVWWSDLTPVRRFGMTTATLAKYGTTLLMEGDLVRHSCVNAPPCPTCGRVGMLCRFEWNSWYIDFGDRRKSCEPFEMTPVRRSA